MLKLVSKIIVALFILSIPLRGDHIIPPSIEPPAPEAITVLLVGDIMLDRGVEYYIQQKEDWGWPFRLISNFLNQGDVVFGNLESMISDQGVNVGSIYSFRADPRVIAGLELAGFNVVSVANNHSFDYTRAAFEGTLVRLKKSGIKYIGGGFSEEEAHAPVIFDIHETKIAFLGYAAVGSPAWQASGERSGIAWMDNSHLETLKRDIETAKQQSDLVIVSFHFGEEYEKEPNEQQRTMAEAAINYGASLVVGHHPHVLQPLERYQEGWIAYSLGNFVFDQRFSEETMRAAILKITIEDKNISQAVLVPTALTDDYQVYLID